MRPVVVTFPVFTEEERLSMTPAQYLRLRGASVSPSMEAACWVEDPARNRDLLMPGGQGVIMPDPEARLPCEFGLERGACIGQPLVLQTTCRSVIENRQGIPVRVAVICGACKQTWQAQLARRRRAARAQLPPLPETIPASPPEPSEEPPPASTPDGLVDRIDQLLADQALL